MIWPFTKTDKTLEESEQEAKKAMEELRRERDAMRALMNGALRDGVNG